MYIVGMNFSGQHDSSVAAMDADGELVFAVAEERLSRAKKDGRLPSRSFVQLAEFGIHRDMIRLLAIPYAQHPMLPCTQSELLDGIFPRTDKNGNAFPPAWAQAIGDLGLPTKYWDHHLAHAACGVYFSPFDQAHALVIDYGAGNSSLFGGLFEWNGTRLVSRVAFSFNNYLSPCALYSDVTAILGFIPNRHEGKVTGLAAYGRYVSQCEAALLRVHEWLHEKDVPLYEWVGDYTGLAPILLPNTYVVDHCRRLLQDFSAADIACTTQVIVERDVCQLVQRMRTTFGFNRLVLAGGLFANVRLNRAISLLPGLEQSFVCPPMGDEGVSVGAAFLSWLDTSERAPTFRRRRHVFLGTEPLSSSVAKTLSDHGLSFVEHGDIAELVLIVANALMAGQSVAVVRGCEEFGPRALGNRSVLCTAEDASIHHTLNAKLRRTDTMPFAPVLRFEDANKCFSDADLRSAGDSVRFMATSLMASPYLAERCPAAVHVDGTARPQIVSRTDNLFLHDVLTLYESMSARPAVINTSFNVHEEPIVSSSEDAIIAFFQSQIDLLVLQDCTVALVDNPHARRLAESLSRTSSGTALSDVLREALRVFAQSTAACCSLWEKN
jgi:carbamoyltransferase